MLLNRHRGLANLHNTFVLLAVTAFYWLYAGIIIAYLSDWIRVTAETKLLPYYLSVLLGLLLGWGQVTRRTYRLVALDWDQAAGLAARQTVVMAGVVFSLMFATQDRSISRLFLGSFLIFTWAGLTWLHLRLPRHLAGRFFGGSQRLPTLFLGGYRHLAGIGEWMEERAHLGIENAGCVALEPGPVPAGMAVLGQVGDLAALLERGNVGQVILMELPKSDQEARRIIEACQAQGCRLLLHHDIEDRLGHPVVPVDQGGQHFFTLHEEPLEEPLNRAIKRAFDLAVCLPVVVLVLPPLCLTVWLVQRFQSPGPLFHIRPRAGAQRAQFAMLKFRTMHVAPADAKAEASQARRDDDRIYPFGHFLRRHSLDEFPQFWNVLTGEMSIVGPRPVMPLLDEEFERQARAYRTRHLVKPGITGLAQSEGFRGEIKTPEQLQERIRLDLHYIAHWSFWLDVQVTARTLLQVFRPPPSAY
jgi:putative colanic acid biosynthesis UDP-glucose lipid carrier transferase